MRLFIESNSRPMQMEKSNPTKIMAKDPKMEKSNPTKIMAKDNPIKKYG